MNFPKICFSLCIVPQGPYIYLVEKQQNKILCYLEDVSLKINVYTPIYEYSYRSPTMRQAPANQQGYKKDETMTAFAALTIVLYFALPKHF